MLKATKSIPEEVTLVAVLVILAVIAATAMIPLQLTADAHHGERTLLRLRAEAAGLRRQWILEAATGSGGLQLVVLNEKGRPRVLPTGGKGVRFAADVMRALRKAPRLHRFILRQLRPCQLDAQLLLHADSAASTALAAGVARAAVTLLPRRWRALLRLRIMPAFLASRTTLQARCIFRARLGTIAITAILLLAAYAAQAINREA